MEDGIELFNHYKMKANALFKKLSKFYGGMHRHINSALLIEEIAKCRDEYIKTYKNYRFQKALLEKEKEENKVVPLRKSE